MRNLIDIGMFFFNFAFYGITYPFSVLTLLVGQQEEHPACKNLTKGLSLVDLVSPGVIFGNIAWTKPKVEIVIVVIVFLQYF